MAKSYRDYHPRAAGLPWVRKEDYAAFLAICEDADGLPATWEEFVKLSEQAEQLNTEVGEFLRGVKAA